MKLSGIFKIPGLSLCVSMALIKEHGVSCALAHLYTFYAQNTYLFCLKKKIRADSKGRFTACSTLSRQPPTLQGAIVSLPLSVFVLMDGSYPSSLYAVNLLVAGPYLIPTEKLKLLFVLFVCTGHRQKVPR